jgi:hypothetical protein
MCSSLGYHTFSIAYVNGKLSIEALSCWLALKLWISMFEVHINMHKSVCETIPLEGPEVLCRCAFGVKGGIEVGGLRKDWSIGRARWCNLWGRMLAYGGVMLLLCTFNGGCSSCSTKSKALWFYSSFWKG